MKNFITQKEYLTLPTEIRAKLVQAFAINKSEGMSVQDNRIVSDGASQADLIAGITIGKMIEFLGKSWKKVDNEKLFDDLFKRCITKLNEQNKNKISELSPEKPV